MLVGEDVEHALHCQRIRNVDPLNAASGNGGRDHDAVRQPGHVVFRCIFRNAANLRTSVDAGSRFAERTGEGHNSTGLLDALVRLRLWRPARRLAQRTHNSPTRQFDFEVVVAEATRTPQQRFCGPYEAFSRRRCSTECRFSLTVAPRLVRHSAERQARILDAVSLDIEADRSKFARFGFFRIRPSDKVS